MQQRIVVFGFILFVSVSNFFSCSSIPQKALEPKNRPESAKWLKITFPERNSLVIAEKDLEILKENSIENRLIKISREIKPFLSSEEMIKDISLTDLNGDSKEEALAIIGKVDEKYGKRLLIFALEGEKIMELWKDINLAKLKPWKIETGDIDGDNRNEILLGVYKKTRYDPEMNNRLFVYGWDKDDLYPKWLGSSLSRPFYDFAVGDIEGNGKVMLVSLEKMKDNESRVMVYQWSGFGFLGYWEARVPEPIKNLMLLDSDNDGKMEIYVNFKHKHREG